MAAERARHILVIGIGNAESGDDGVGLAVAERVSGLGLSKVDVAKHCGENGGGKVCHGSGGIVPLPAE